MTIARRRETSLAPPERNIAPCHLPQNALASQDKTLPFQSGAKSIPAAHAIRQPHKNRRLFFIPQFSSTEPTAGFSCSNKCDPWLSVEEFASKGGGEADDCLHGGIDRGHTASICRRRFPRLSSKDDTPRPRRSSGTAQVATPKAALVRPDSPENDPSDEFRPMVEYGPQTRRPVEGYLATCPRGASAGHGRRRARQASPASDNRDPERTEMVSPRRDPLSGFLGNSECDRV